MEQREYWVIGVMSGTSLDGIDLAYVHFKKSKKWTFSIISTITIAYPAYWVKILSNINKDSEQKIKKYESDYIFFLGKIILDFIHKNSISEIDAICSHGHTVIHDPDKKITYQMGNQQSLADFLNIPLVCDFRSQDISLGGQGAPLVPIGDSFLFSEYNACLNMGGFANVSMLDNGKMIAFDICSVNIVLNFLAKKKGLPYDDRGKLAQKGEKISGFLMDLEALDFYKQSPPKSLGIEWVHYYIFPLLKKYKNQKTEDLIYTYSLHISNIVGQIFKKGVRVLTTGGGAKNTFLMELIKKRSCGNFILPDIILIDFKEALIFGLLGVLKIRNEVNCLASVTGAPRDHSSGIIFYPLKTSKGK